MSEARLDIRADARQLSTAARVMQRFGLTGMRASRRIKREMRDLNKEITSLTSQQKILTAELLKIEKGTESYKKLQQQLKGVKGALKEASTEAAGLGGMAGAGRARPGGGAGQRGAGYARVAAQQMIGTLGAAGPEQTYGTLGQFSGAMGTALSNIPYVGAAFGMAGAVAQAGLNVMQRRASMLISAQKARQQAGSFIRAGIGEESVISMAGAAAKSGYGAEEAYGILRAFGQGAGYRAGISEGTLGIHRMGFGPGAMSGAALYAPGFGGRGIGRETSYRRGEAGKDLLRTAAAQSRFEARTLIGAKAEKSITPTTVEQRLTEMVGYLKQLALEGVVLDPVEFQRETMRIFSLGLQTQNRELFAGGRAFRFQTAMRAGQRQEGGMMNFMAIMSQMGQGKDLITAMEEARLGRVPLEDMQKIMRQMGVHRQRWMQLELGQGAGVPMAEIAAFAGGDLGRVPEGYEEMARGGALKMWRGAAPVSPFQKKLLEIKAKEMKAAKGDVPQMIKTAEQLVTVQTNLAAAGRTAHNALLDFADGLHDVLRGASKALNFIGINVPTMPAQSGVTSMKLHHATTVNKGGVKTELRSVH
jgi:hypothetical protein